VHIYRLISEYTIEENILRKSLQKRQLDDLVLQEGQFNTEFFIRNKFHVSELFEDDTNFDQFCT
jgi:helicase SWR1